ncbi:MAG: OB-fold domain-containing protein [Myxococcota bacterium]|jgi:hypothetical protein|nr:DNA-binding protein [bacterium]MDP6074174.1 OB-fold domain-containing protein [Myxococcota bacterium]MDP6242913.1 OB-fold domain-containing protein [Myxococcota bacterium]MDP7073189.1 OB-fold domain-containing protein [Myxococcota bacterium]MDP7298519.1 OB-fold domain-containing protein [Myxococcota bacterium]
MHDAAQPYTTEHVVEYAYKRSLGPVLSRFFTALRAGQILGSRTAEGRVLVPPMEHDPETGDGLGPDDMLEVGPGGRVATWAWVNHPRENHPLDRPFAFALVELDGATTGFLHAVDAGGEEHMHSGMRVMPRWRPERTGEIHDLVCFEPEDTP